MKIYSIGGYNEVGKNMTAVEVGGEVVICDMGFFMEKIIPLQEESNIVPDDILIKEGAVPDDSVLHNKNVVAIVASHAHLDHIGAIPVLAERYKCPIIATPYTIEIIKHLVKDRKKRRLLGYLTPLNTGSTLKITQNIKVELVHITHSIPQSTLIALHTKEGIVTYLNDYKLDNTPTMGKKPDYERMKQLAKIGIKAHIEECVRIEEHERTSSEYIAQIMVHDALNRAYESGKAVIITTFASHIARIRNIVKANQNRRKIICIGRSMATYLKAAATLNLIDLSDIAICPSKNQSGSVLEKVAKNPTGYLLIVTGNQGEPNSVLSSIAKNDLEYKLQKGDEIIFSSFTIPSPINKANKHTLELLLKKRGARVINNVHVSGHAKREDHRDMIRLLKPKNIIPSHGNMEKLASFSSLAAEEGYVLGKTFHIMANGGMVEIK
ncbi:MAG: ribonuclease J [Candidatus Nanohalarchaeota archaeon]|nr:MAG: ribonuclease J [Candidatus Nanohaloarchaeota archaeon]